MTRTAIKPFPEREGYSVSKGERHLLVMIMQIMLDTLKIYYDELGAFTVSGCFDDATESAVREFQRANSLPGTGQVDKITWDRMAEEFNEALKDNQ